MQHGGDRSETQLRSLADETRMRTTNGVRPWCDGRARDPFCLCPCPSLALSPDHDQTRRSVATSLGPGPSAGNRRLGGLAVACPSRGRGRGVGVGVGIDSQLLGRSSRRPGAAGLRERAREDRRSSDQLELGGGLREQGRTEPGGGGLSEVGDCGSKGGPAIIYKDSYYSRARIQNFRTPAL